MTEAALRRAGAALCLAGLGIAGYLTYVHYAGLQPVCGISHGCETVQTSSYARLAGVPVAVLGLITYGLILTAQSTRDQRVQLSGYALTLIGVSFSLYLTYRELFTIHAICSWCVWSAVVFTLLAMVETARVLRVTGTRLTASAEGA
jgi:uncharacterized membrane protein